jgi:hypothetical protein
MPSFKTLAAAAVGAAGVSAASQGPCDIFGAAGTPCVAAHSVTRALYSQYQGPLYQVRRLGDNATLDINPIAPGGPANGPAQDTFCAGADCVIQIIYDQVRETRKTTVGVGDARERQNKVNLTFSRSCAGPGACAVATTNRSEGR